MTAAGRRRPDPFPWLDHLRRDRRGLPVPYINAWGPESAATVELHPDPNVGGRLAVFHADDFDAAPDFTRESPQRQRECMVRGLCQVCGLEVPWPSRSLIVSSISVRFASVPGLGTVAVVHEPWLCGRCVRIAVNWCPALIRRRHGEDLVVHPVTRPGDVVQSISVGRVDGHEDRGDQVVMWVKQTLLTLQVLSS